MRAVSALLLLILLAGCDQRDPAPAVLGWQQRFSAASVALGGWFGGLERGERELYLQELAHSGEPVRLRQDGRPTPLAGSVFPPAAIRARCEAVALLGEHAERLARLAADQAPDATASAASTLAGRIGTLAAGDPRLGEYAGPVGVLAGLVAGAVVEHQRQQLLDQALRRGGPAVERLLDLLEADLAESVGPLRLTGAAQARDTLISDYNRRRQEEAALPAAQRATPAERLRELQAIAALSQRVELLRGGAPLRLPAAMRQAYRRLATVAGGHQPPTPAQQAALRQALDDLQAETAATATLIAPLEDRP